MSTVKTAASHCCQHPAVAAADVAASVVTFVAVAETGFVSEKKSVG